MIILSKVLKESNQFKILAIKVAAKRTLDNALLLIRTSWHHGIKLIKEEQGWSVLLCFLENLANLLLGTVNPSASQVIGNDLHEIDAYLLCHLLRKEGFSTSCWTVKQHGRRLDAIDFGTFTVLEYVDESFRHSLLQFVHAGNITETIAFLLL